MDFRACIFSRLRVSTASFALLPTLLASLTLLGVGISYAEPVSTEGEAPTTKTETARPNILIILADDMGWSDVGYHGSEIRTPNIDRIAREGIELDRFYVQPTCSPTRSGLMTGKSPASLGIHLPISKNEVNGLPKEEKLLPEYLADAGYQPLMAGKWHLGHYTPDMFPQARGFEHFYGHVTGGVGYWDHTHGGGYDWQRNGVTVREDGYTTNLIANETLQLIRERDRTRPTFLYVAFNAPHLPNEAPVDAIDRYLSVKNIRRRLHAAMVDEMDREIGRILDALETEGMLENTIVLFSSDNGGLNEASMNPTIARAGNFLLDVFGRPVPVAGLEFLTMNALDGGADNSPLPGGKGSSAEGGARVPAAIWWPGRLEGKRHEGFMTISDVLPTLLEATGSADLIPHDLNGASQWAALSGEGEPGPTPDYVSSGSDRAALYRAPWKLYPEEPPLLYNIYADPLEQKDVAADQPEIVKAMSETLENWPTSEIRTQGILWSLLDPDSFGGEEDREPWADVARDRAAGGRP